MKFGITQGRLTNERKGILQKFPKNWENEFVFLQQTELDYIELFLENRINKNNPIWSKIGQRRLLDKLKVSKLDHHIVCDNYILNKSLDDHNLNKYYIKIFKNLKEIKCKLFIIPILGKNFSKKNFCKLVKFIHFVKQMSKKNKINISLEIDEDFKVFKKILAIRKINNIGITFDTGNFYLKNKNILKNLRKYYPYVNHIHLKDRDSSGKNVIFGDGNIKFQNLFKFLKKKNYDKYFTFETNRGRSAIETAVKNLKIVKKFI